MFLKNRLVSSANVMNSAIFDALTMSFIKIMNKSGAKMEHWAPHMLQIKFKS